MGQATEHLEVGLQLLFTPSAPQKGTVFLFHHQSEPNFFALQQHLECAQISFDNDASWMGLPCNLPMHPSLIGWHGVSCWQ